MGFIQILEKCLGKEAIKEFYPMQPGDVYRTYADLTDLMNDLHFKPETTIRVGLESFVQWYLKNYNKYSLNKTEI